MQWEEPWGMLRWRITRWRTTKRTPGWQTCSKRTAEESSSDRRDWARRRTESIRNERATDVLNVGEHIDPFPRVLWNLSEGGKQKRSVLWRCLWCLRIQHRTTVHTREDQGTDRAVRYPWCTWRGDVSAPSWLWWAKSVWSLEHHTTNRDNVQNTTDTQHRKLNSSHRSQKGKRGMKNRRNKQKKNKMGDWNPNTIEIS